MYKAYKISIIYFSMFSLLLLLSGIFLFGDKIGFSIEDINNYYLGNSEQFSEAKTYSGILKIILPHLFSFGLFCMVILHFLIFTDKKLEKSTIVLVYLTIGSAFFELFSPFFILLGASFFACVKIISFFVFNLAITYALWLLFRSIVKR